MEDIVDYNKIKQENENLRIRLLEAEETLSAIRNHEVDALIVEGPEGDRVFTLEGADQPYRIFVESMSEGAAIVDASGSILHCNRHFAELLRLPLNQVIGTCLYDFVQANGQGPLNIALQVSGEDRYRGEFILRTPLAQIPVYISARGLLLNQINVFCIIITDISERKRAEAEIELYQNHLEELVDERTRELHEVNTRLVAEMDQRQKISEKLKQLASFVELNPNPVFEVDFSGAMLYTNPAARQVLARNNMDETHIRDFLPPDLRTIVEAWDKRTDETFLREVAVGGMFFSESIFLSPNSNTVRIYAHDITNLIQAEVALRESEDRLYQALRINRSFAFEWDLSTDTLVRSQSCEDVLGFDGSSSTGKELFDRVAEDDRPALKSVISSLNPMKTSYQTEYRFMRDDGELLDLSETGECFFDAQGKPQKLIGITTDISARKKIEHALRQSEERFRNMFEQHQVVMLLIDPVTGNIVEANPAAEEFYGYSAEELVTMKYMDIGGFSFEQHGADVVRNKDNLVFQHRLADNTTRWVEIYSALFEFQGRVLVFSIVHDITKRRHAEEALETVRNEAVNEASRLKAVMEALPVGLCIIDDNGNPLLVNRRYEDVCGSHRTLAASIGECGDAWWIDSDKPVMPHEWASVKALQEGETTIGQLIRIRKASGDEIHIHNSTAPIRDSACRIIGSVIAVMDISEEQHAKAELKKTVERLDIVSDTASRLLFTSDPQDIVNELCSRVMEHLDCHVFFNYLIDEENEFLRLNAYAGIPNHIAESIRTLQFGVAVCGCVARDGSRLIAEDIPTTKDPRTELVSSFGIQAYVCHPLYARGKVIGTLSFGTRSRTTFKPEEIALMKTVADQVAVAMERRRLLESEKLRADDLERRVERRTSELSDAYEKLQIEMAERARIEEQLRQSQKMEAMGTLAGGIAHDFNNILAGIMGFAEMVEEDLPPDSPSVQRIQKVLKAATRGRDLVKQILAFSRKTKVSRKSIAVTPIIQETIQLLRASMPATIKIELELAAEKDTVFASPEEPQQIIMNLATNGYNAMRKSGGTLKISTRNVSYDENSTPEVAMQGEYLEIVVADTGEGISPEVINRIFEPFYTTKGVGEGTGMGLAVVYGTVKNLQGMITVQSEPGHGAIFKVALPLATANEPSMETTSHQVHKGSGHIMFVDDEEFLREWGQSALERLGYTVTALTDSSEALNLFSSDPTRFDLVITDQTMPKMTGTQLAQELIKIRHDIPIILCSGHNDEMSAQNSEQMGIKKFVMKPLAKKELSEVVRNVLEKRVDGTKA